jgi:transposase
VEAVYQRCAGIDVGKAELKVCLRVQGRGSRPTQSTVRTWSTSTPQLQRLRSWLVAEGVERVVLESTSDYWRPVFYVLSEKLDVVLVKASDVKAMPGRKSDVCDAEWLADLAAHQLVRGSFVPPEQQRQLRDFDPGPCPAAGGSDPGGAAFGEGLGGGLHQVVHGGF